MRQGRSSASSGPSRRPTTRRLRDESRLGDLPRKSGRQSRCGRGLRSRTRQDGCCQVVQRRFHLPAMAQHRGVGALARSAHSCSDPPRPETADLIDLAQRSQSANATRVA